MYCFEAQKNKYIIMQACLMFCVCSSDDWLSFSQAKSGVIHTETLLQGVKYLKWIQPFRERLSVKAYAPMPNGFVGNASYPFLYDLLVALT